MKLINSIFLFLLKSSWIRQLTKNAFYKYLRFTFLGPEGQSMGILILRGGLGNQLFQLSGGLYFQKRLSFQCLIYDFDLRLSSRDNFLPRYQNLNLHETEFDVFRYISKSIMLRVIQISWGLSQRIDFIPILNESSLLDSKIEIPSIFFISDNF